MNATVFDKEKQVNMSIENIQYIYNGHHTIGYTDKETGKETFYRKDRYKLVSVWE